MDRQSNDVLEALAAFASEGVPSETDYFWRAVHGDTKSFAIMVPRSSIEHFIASSLSIPHAGVPRSSLQ